MNGVIAVVQWAKQDFNADGIDDFIIGAPNNDGYRGVTCVVFGKNGTWPGQIFLSSLDGTDGIIIQGETSMSISGGSVSEIRDFNNDGISDIVIGALYCNKDKGCSYVLFGKQGPWSRIIKLSSLNGINGIKFYGESGYDLNHPTGDRSGYPVADAGDFNADGIDDLIYRSERCFTFK